jgi:hypothetical protein
MNKLVKIPKTDLEFQNIINSEEFEIHIDDEFVLKSSDGELSVLKSSLYEFFDKLQKKGFSIIRNSRSLDEMLECKQIYLIRKRCKQKGNNNGKIQ